MRARTPITEPSRVVSDICHVIVFPSQGARTLLGIIEGESHERACYSILDDSVMCASVAQATIHTKASLEHLG